MSKKRLASVGSVPELDLIRLALDFWTWRRLSSQGLDDKAAANLMAAAITTYSS